VSAPIIFLSCGEASGEVYATELARALRAQRSELRLVGIGGSALRDAGVELWADSAELGMMGFTQVVRHLPRLWALRRALVQRAVRERVDLFLPVDFPGFHISLAGQLRERGIGVLDFIPPKTWSWGKWRQRALRRSVDRCAVMFPFEVQHYQEAGIDARFVGHPLMDRPSREDESPRTGLLLVPGSRRQELQGIASVMAASAGRLRRLQPRLKIRISRAPSIRPEWLEPMREVLPQAEIVEGPLDPQLRRAALALVTSGTASFEAALAAVPHLILYRTSALSYRIARTLAKVEHMGMANIVLARRAFPEFLQAECSVERVADALVALASDETAREAQRRASVELRGLLGPPGAIDRVAELALQMLPDYTAPDPEPD